MDKQIILDFHKNGLTIKEIMDKTGKTYMSIWHILDHYNLTPHSHRRWWTQEDLNNIEKMLNEGYTFAEIGEVFGKQHFNISTIVRKYGFKSLIKPDITSLEKEQIKYLYETTDLTIDEIAIKIGRGHTSISNVLKESGITPEMTQVKNLNKELSKENKRRCGSCKLILDKKNFNGNTCKKCINKLHQERWRFKKQNGSLEDLIKYRLKNVKSRAKRNKIDFSLTGQDVLKMFTDQNGKCYYTGKEMSLKVFPGNLDIFSVDRIDSNKGYSIDNCVLCRFIINIMKNSLTIPEFIKISQEIVDYSDIFKIC